MSSDNIYDTKTICYHWISAAIILTLWVVGQNIDSFEKGDPRVIVRSIQITLGLIMALVFVIRVNWRIRGGVKLPQPDGVQGKITQGTHHLLYALMGLTILIGIAAVWVRGDNIFNVIKIPAFDPTDEDLRENVVDIHGFFANSLLILAGGHALLAIWNHRILKDGILKRMWPTLK